MAELRRLFESLGLKEVETFIASGNVIFNSGSRDLGTLELLIEDCLRRSLGYEVSTFVRTEEEVASILECKPFKESRVRSALALNVAFLAQAPNAAARKLIMAFRTEMEDFHVQGREVYWLCQTRQSDSKFSNARFEKILQARATWRGLNTIARLAAKYPCGV